MASSSAKVMKVWCERGEAVQCIRQNPLGVVLALKKTG